MRVFLIHMIYWFRYYISDDKKNKGKNRKLGSKSTAILALAVLQWANLLILLAIIQLYTGFDAFDRFDKLMPHLNKREFLSWFWMILILSPFIALNYFIVYHDNTKKEIEAYFKTFSKDKKELKKSKIVFFSYVILTLTALFIFGPKFTEKFKKDKSNQSIYRK